MHVLKPSRVFRLPPVVDDSCYIRLAFSFFAVHIMAGEDSSRASPDMASSEPDTEPPTSQTSMSSLAAHEAAAEKNAKRKAENAARLKANRNAAKVLTLPQSSNVSVLQESLASAKQKKGTKPRRRRRLSRRKWRQQGNVLRGLKQRQRS